MKLNPNNLRNSKKQRVYNETLQMQAVIDKGYKAILKADNTDWDTNSAKDHVSVTGVLEKELRNNPNITWDESSQVDSAQIKGPGNYQADIKLQGWSAEWAVPIELSASVSRVETDQKISYTRRYNSDVQGPNTRKTILDKKTGEIDVREYLLGFIRVPTTFNWFSLHANEQSTIDRYDLDSY